MNYIVQKFGFDQFLNNKILGYIDFNNHNAKFKKVLNELTDKLTVKKIMFNKIKFIEKKKSYNTFKNCYSVKIDKNSYENAALKDLLSSKSGDYEDKYYNPYFNMKIINMCCINHNDDDDDFEDVSMYYICYYKKINLLDFIDNYKEI